MSAVSVVSALGFVSSGGQVRFSRKQTRFLVATLEPSKNSLVPDKIWGHQIGIIMQIGKNEHSGRKTIDLILKRSGSAFSLDLYWFTNSCQGDARQFVRLSFFFLSASVSGA